MKKGILFIAVGLVLFAGPCFAQDESSEPQGEMTDQDFYIQQRETMGEIVRDMGLSDEDQGEVVEYVIDEGGEPTGESLRDSGISDEAWEQIMDDARME